MALLDYFLVSIINIIILAFFFYRPLKYIKKINGKVHYIMNSLETLQAYAATAAIEAQEIKDRIVALGDTIASLTAQLVNAITPEQVDAILKPVTDELMAIAHPEVEITTPEEII